MMRALLASEAGGSTPNEDWGVATLGMAVVLDGLSTSPSRETGCRHGTPWFVRNLGAQLVAALVDDSTSTSQALGQAISCVAELHQDSCDLYHLGTPSATVAVLRLNQQRRQWEYLVLADSVVVLDLPDGVHAITDSRVDTVATVERDATTRHPIGSAEHQQSVAALIETQRRVRNTPDGYWVAAADPHAADHAITGVVAIADLRRAAVLTDGASRLVDQYAEVTWTEMLDLLSQHGPKHLIERVRIADNADPAGPRWNRYKTSDDATAVYLE